MNDAAMQRAFDLILTKPIRDVKGQVTLLLLAARVGSGGSFSAVAEELEAELVQEARLVAKVLDGRLAVEDASPLICKVADMLKIANDRGAFRQ
jgi:hypothetical protein